MALTYTKIARRQGSIITYQVCNGATLLGTVEEFIDRFYGAFGPGTVARRRRWRARRTTGLVVARQLWTKEQAGKLL